MRVGRAGAVGRRVLDAGSGNGATSTRDAVVAPVSNRPSAGIFVTMLGLVGGTPEMGPFIVRSSTLKAASYMYYASFFAIRFKAATKHLCR